ncbi:MAG: HPP family protein [Thermodesulfobacteriota bacterium]
MIAAHIMFTDMVTVRSGDTLEKALKLMDETKAHEVAVVDDEGRVVGMLTPDVILHKTVMEKSGENSSKGSELPSPARRFFENFRGLSSRDVGEAMERDVIKVGPETSTAEVTNILLNRNKGIANVAVVDDRDVLLGIIRPLDVVRRLWEHVDAP